MNITNLERSKWFSNMENYNHKIALYEDLCPEGLTKPVVESITFEGIADDTSYTDFDTIGESMMLNGKDLFFGIICVATDLCDKQTLQKFFKAYKNTAKYEFTHKDYRDIPLIGATNTFMKIVKECCCGNPNVMDTLNDMDGMFGQVIDDAYDELGENVVVPSTTPSGFNPNPFDVYNLTPFPVATRTLTSTVSRIFDAETDDEITEAMLEFARMRDAFNEQYTVVGEGENAYLTEAVGKRARMASDKANKKFSKNATRDKTKNPIEAVKRTLDPMEKFIQAQTKKIKDADSAERRKVILSNSGMPKVMRWVKRGIGLAIGGAIGAHIPIVALITGISFIGMVASDRVLDKRERAKILKELEDELQICNEKIDDSRGDDNKQKKYELMRIRNELKRTQDKIRFGLKY